MGTTRCFWAPLSTRPDFLRHCRTPRAFRRATIRSGPQSPEPRGVATKNGFALFLGVRVKVILDKIRHLRVRSRYGTHRPVRTDHQPAGPEVFKRHVEIGP